VGTGGIGGFSEQRRQIVGIITSQRTADDNRSHLSGIYEDQHMSTYDIGLIGLAVMGRNLVLNMERNGFSVAVFNRTLSTLDDFINGQAKGRRIVGCRSVESLCGMLNRPRKVMLMVKAGEAVDNYIDKLIAHLDPGDIIIDGGNSDFRDTIRRTRYVESKGLLYIGTGVSGGEEGALNGPSIMPGGSPDAWPHVRSILQTICAHVEDGNPCCEYVGPDGAGHYVKMVHNGIEYADMQLICEAYYLMDRALGMSAEDQHRVFADWNKGKLNSYLTGITADILSHKDPETGNPMVDIIQDAAGQKGTGKWTSQNAMDLGVPVATIAEAVFARCMSAIKDERVAAGKVLAGPDSVYDGDRPEFIGSIREALYASKICSYAQGFQLMRAASEHYEWHLKFGDIALMWRAGCIIRARFLDSIKEAFDVQPDLTNLLLAPFFKDAIDKAQPKWRHVVATSAGLGIPVPAFSSALAYYDSYRRDRLPANLLQAQRDYFGAHTYQRIDKKGIFHTDWLGE